MHNKNNQQSFCKKEETLISYNQAASWNNQAETYILSLEEQ